MLALLIVACEIGFWLFVVAGLTSRYIFNMPKLGLILLGCTPLVDLVLLVATGIDLKNGASASVIHSLSAIYLGVSIAYGHRIIRWADIRFAHRFNQGPAPRKTPKYGVEKARYEREMWFHHLLAWGIGSIIMFALVWLTGDSERTSALSSTISTWALILMIDFVISFSYTLWPKKDPAADLSSDKN